MITPEEFPYIKSLWVNDCHTYKDFNIELQEYKPFSHLILTGKNGSGKSTILRVIDKIIGKLRLGKQSESKYTMKGFIHVPAFSDREVNMIGIKTINYKDKYSIEPNDPGFIWLNQSNQSIYSYFKVYRRSKVIKVEGPTKETDFIDQLSSTNSTEFFTEKFTQYLVNKKIEQAFNQLDNNKEKISQNDVFFATLTNTFQNVFKDKNLSLVFIRESFEFFIKLTDGRQLTFDVLSEGYSTLLSILMDLFMRVDLIRKQVGDYTYNPCGIVLIDEPETHLHLQLQEQVLPLLTNLFPNIQFIAATHSPAVIASIKQATIFDLTTKESRGSEETVGRSYSDLMMSHFGLNNEYSETADRIINQVNNVLNTLDNKSNELKSALQKIYDENSAYLSPTLKVELELLIAQQEAQHSAHQ